MLGPRNVGTAHASLFERDGVDLLLWTTVTSIEMTDTGTDVSHLVAHSPAGRLELRGSAFVIATGGIETARLLLASTSRAWPNGIGNGTDHVGRHFMDHPQVETLRMVGDPDEMDVAFFVEHDAGCDLRGRRYGEVGALELSAELCSAGVGRARLAMEPAGVHLSHPVPRVWDGERIPPAPAEDSGDRNELAVIVTVEQFPDRASRVGLGPEVDRLGVPRPVLDWNPSAGDRRTLEAATDAAAAVADALGATRIRRHDIAGEWPWDSIGGPHHLGTARMADQSDLGVVDRDCTVHGTANLHIAGGAVFPTGGHAPPTLTIVALALRLGDRLADQLRGAEPPGSLRTDDH